MAPGIALSFSKNRRSNVSTDWLRFKTPHADAECCCCRFLFTDGFRPLRRIGSDSARTGAPVFHATGWLPSSLPRKTWRKRGINSHLMGVQLITLYS